MATLKITGGKELSGNILISGSKNATLPIICATLLTDEQCVLRNVPDISDAHNLVSILRGLGSKVVFEDHVITIDNSGVDSYSPDKDLVKKLRGSLLLLGPLLGRFNKVSLPTPGGDAIGRRPIDTHLMVLEELGAKIVEGDNLEISAEELVGKDIILKEASVTATENAIMAAVKARGTTQLHLCAIEPHVQDLCRMLNAMGAKISGIGTHDLTIEGVGRLNGVEHNIIFDNEVTCSFINLAAATKSPLVIEQVQPQYLSSALIQFKQMNVNFEVAKEKIVVNKPDGPYQASKIKAGLYPGLMSDYIPPFAVLATQAEGTSMIHEWMYEGRLG